jgi:predicted dehydrogenase
MGESKKNNDSKKISRRDILKGLATTPVLGVLAYDFLKKRAAEKVKKKVVNLNLGLNDKDVSVQSSKENTGELLRIGIIGVGTRANALIKALGFVSPDWYNTRAKLKSSNSLEKYNNQEILNVEIAAVCDVFDLHAENGLNLARYGIQPNGKPANNKNVKRYFRYQDLLADKSIDAVIIATPDFHHARMTIDAINAGKHVYCEKTMSLTEEELHDVYHTVKKSGLVFQLGHQLSKSESYKKAREIVNKNILGKVTLIEATTNRNTPSGAWYRHLYSNGKPKPGSLKTIDWEQWLGTTPKVPFSIDRYYGWARYFSYDTGLAGQLLSHEIDGINQIMGFGIPHSVVASGGIYFWDKSTRDMPDTFQVTLEFPDREFSVLYSATLANSRQRGRVFMGHDASMEVGNRLKLYANPDSPKYINKIKSGLISPSEPFYTYPKKPLNLDAITSATERYYAERGLTDTKVGGKNIDITYLHIKEWLDVIRNGGTTACNIDIAYMDTVAVLMAHKSYVEKRRVQWDPIKRKIV